MNNIKDTTRLHPAVFLATLLSLFYWSYLGLTSKVIIFHDSFSYQNLGNLLSNESWKNYFITGPNREPLYPLLISWSMRVARWLNVNYLSIQIFWQIFILMFAQFLTAKMLKKLRISDRCSILIIAYMGFSPTFVNSGLILYSEILTYPMILWLVLRAASAWTDFQTVPMRSIVLHACLFAAAALAITFTKGIFEIIVPFLLLPYFVLLVKKETTKGIRLRIGIFLVVFLVAFEAPVVAYKSLNKAYNGVYGLTDRGSFALYGNTARRMLPLDMLRLKTAVVTIGGMDVCGSLYGNATCAPWGFLQVDILANQKQSALALQTSNAQQLNDAMMKASVQEILKNPFQYSLLTVVEGLKSFFWESQQIFCVAYPSAVNGLYSQAWLRYPLRFLIAFVSMAALAHGITKIFKGRREIFRIGRSTDGKTSLELYVILTITVYILFSSIFYITPRYVQPLIPLFMATMAFFMQDLCSKPKPS